MARRLRHFERQFSPNDTCYASIMSRGKISFVLTTSV